MQTSPEPSDAVARIRAELAAVKRRPASEARVLSPAFYTAPEFLALEREQLFVRDWA